MAKFYGTVEGNRGAASRTGSRNMTVAARSYDGSVISNLYYNMDNKISVRIDVEPDSTSYGRHTYFNGTLEELKEALKMYQDVQEAREQQARDYEAGLIKM